MASILLTVRRLAFAVFHGGPAARLAPLACWVHCNGSPQASSFSTLALLSGMQAFHYGGDGGGGHEDVGASVVAGVNAPPVLEPSDLVPLAIEFAVVVDRLLAIGFGRDARRDAAFGKGLTEPVGS